MKKSIIFLSVLSVLLYFGCYDQFGDPISQTGESDIYVAGKNAAGFATYWKNGVAFVNENVQGAYTNIAVSNGNVYVSGYTGSTLQSNSTAIYWLNGAVRTISTYARAHSIFVSGGNVFVAGLTWNEYSQYPVISAWYSRAVYWRNGSLVSLAGGYQSDADALCIFASGNNVYVGGSYIGTGRTPYWNNGATINLTPSLPGVGIVDDIYVSATNDVHIAGFHYDAGTGTMNIKHWKNGVQTFQYNPGDAVQTLTYWQNKHVRLAVAGNDVYIASDELGATSKYLKNGVLENFTNEAGASGQAVVAVQR